ncbi:hypothetical protein E1B28_010134 [Marasmius oreades]|uniref:C2H2-type domain-containing protein n=1 Tax=Marasmius oreades TaxID=181124 RepID=A0A9P7RWM8_9AGAR|nr:uncharacterized protein E1B28_010134 [Marasmius oreades]KAG7091077.1 hypothetical protein E1B28_010134 [Marasmius oreades]
MYRRSYVNPSMDDQEPEEKLVLPSISRILDNRDRAPSSLTLPPLPDPSMQRTRPENWGQFSYPNVSLSPKFEFANYATKVSTKEYLMNPVQNDHQYTSSRPHDSTPDPHASALQTDHALSLLQSHSRQRQQYATNTPFSPYAYSQGPSTSSRDGYQAMDPSASYVGPSDAPIQNPRAYYMYAPLQRSKSYHSFESNSRHASSSSATYRHANLYGQRIPDNTSSNSKHECEYCGKKFSRPSGLKIHMTTHNGEKPYVCPQEGCHRAFSVRSNMRRHVRIVHQNSQGNITSDSSEDGDSVREASV